ncbi:MAG: hypothetical protein J6G98_01500 [Bacilli bacterium]|nr:hypothetical protein [Bacilli bacterium]
MDNIEIPSFVNDRYNQKKQEEYKPTHEKKSGIKNLKVYKRAIQLIAFGAVLTVASTNPNIKETVIDSVQVVVNKIADHDNKYFNDRGEYLRQEVIDLTGSTPEEITERGMSR